MFRLLRGRKGQGTAEYAILIGIIIAVAIAMQTYIKRGMQGRVYDASNKFYDSVTGDSNWASVSTTSADVLTTKQFEPTALSSRSTQQVLEEKEVSNMELEGKVTRESVRRTKQADGDYQKQDY